MNIGRKYATSAASEEELFVSLTLYDKETDEYSEIKLIDESNGKDGDQECSCLDEMKFFPNQKPINRTYGYTFDFARINSLKYCVLETIKETKELWPIKSVTQKCFAEYVEDDDEEYDKDYRLDNFFAKPPVIPTPPLRISVDFPKFYDYDLILDAIKNLKLHGPS
uniref:Uncharacterized protein n=1 Tax=Acrobeloides nanus TaxID=290746 RepID=A0A914DCW8_9BILA